MPVCRDHQAKKWAGAAKALLLLAYAAMHVFFASNHVNWRDEAQAWLMARDLSVPMLVRQMSYEGHPCLWHLILMPFAKLGFPYETMNVLSLLFMLGAAVILLWKSPFPVFVQACVLMSSAWVYLLPTISRSYCLIPPIVCLLATWYPKRHERPVGYGVLIALLIQTHVIMLAMAGLLALSWMVETIEASRRKEKPFPTLLRGLGWPFISVVFLAVQLCNVTSSSAFHLQTGSLGESWMLFVENVRQTFMAEELAPAFQWMAYLAFWLAAAALIACVIRRRKQAELVHPLVIVGLSLLFFWLFSMFVYKTSAQRTACIKFVILWGCWVLCQSCGRKTLQKAALCLLCALFVPGMAVRAHWPEGKGYVLYSDSRNCASYMQEHLPKDAPVLTWQQAQGSAVLAYLDWDHFYELSTGEAYSYATWTEPQASITTYEGLCAWAAQRFPGEEDVYVLLHSNNGHEFVIPGVEGLTAFLTGEHLLYHTPEDQLVGSSHEIYELYRVPIRP